MRNGGNYCSGWDQSNRALTWTSANLGGGSGEVSNLSDINILRGQVILV